MALLYNCLEIIPPPPDIQLHFYVITILYQFFHIINLPVEFLSRVGLYIFGSCDAGICIYPLSEAKPLSK